MESTAAAYRRCRELHRRHGRTYYLATMLLPTWKRRHVHALYGFTRYADEIVDSSGSTDERSRRLAEWGQALRAGLAGQPVDDPLLPAVLHTIAIFGIDGKAFEVFLDSMAMDLTVSAYRDYDDLLTYMEGSAAVIGELLLPILDPADPATAREPARQLGFAFQLTNMLRDVAEDLWRGRIYLPAEDLQRFGVTAEDLAEASRAGRASDPIRELIAYEIRRCRQHYALAEPGIAMLARSSQPCVWTAFRAYGRILDVIEQAGNDVFSGRAVVPTRFRLVAAARSLLDSARVHPGTV